MVPDTSSRKKLTKVAKAFQVSEQMARQTRQLERQVMFVHNNHQEKAN